MNCDVVHVLHLFRMLFICMYVYIYFLRVAFPMSPIPPALRVMPPALEPILDPAELIAHMDRVCAEVRLIQA